MYRLGFLFAILSLVLMASALPQAVRAGLPTATPKMAAMAGSMPMQRDACIIVTPADKGCCDSGAAGSACDFCCAVMSPMGVSVPVPTRFTNRPTVMLRPGYQGWAAPPTPPPPRLEAIIQYRSSH